MCDLLLADGIERISRYEMVLSLSSPEIYLSLVHRYECIRMFITSVTCESSLQECIVFVFLNDHRDVLVYGNRGY